MPGVVFSEDIFVFCGKCWHLNIALWVLKSEALAL